MKTLVVFDFDYTVVNDNSDTWVIRCLPDQCLPDSLTQSYQKGQWTAYMGRVMSYIGDQAVSPASVRTVMESIPFTDGMTELLTFISEHKSTIDCIVISDSNTIFIDWILQAAGVQAAVDRVFTNPARFDERGYMEVQRHHRHDCTRCPVNLCKRKVLEAYLAERRAEPGGGVEYRRTFYVGDGGNDLCPTACLGGGDVVMPRRGFTLERLLLLQRDPAPEPAPDPAPAPSPDPAPLLKASVVSWSSGADILHQLKTGGGAA